jgi:hypothetical protein
VPTSQRNGIRGQSLQGSPSTPRSCRDSPADKKSRMHSNALIAAVLCFASLTVSVPALATHRALLVGIDDYAASSVPDLHGAVNDVALMKSLLVNRYAFAPKNIAVLPDSTATRSAILAGLETLIAQTQRDDVVVFYFSGHGSRVRDRSDDESDHWDETLVAHDSRLTGVFDISDDELNEMVARLSARTPNVTVLLDSCYSGTGARLTATVRRAPDDLRDPPQRAGGRAPEGVSDIRALGANFVLISGSAATELSHESPFEGRIHGAMTYHLVRTLQASRHATYRSLFPELVSQVSGQFPSQHPQLEGTGMDSPVFGISSAAVERYVLVEPEGDQLARVMAGSMYGIGKGTVIDVHAPGSESIARSTPIATLTVTQANVDSAVGRLTGAATIPAHSRGRLAKVAFASQPRTVALSGELPGALQSALRTSVGRYRSLRMLTGVDALALADFRVLKANTQAEIVARDGSSLSRNIGVADSDAAERLSTQMHDWARWTSLMELKNPSSTLAVEVSLRPWGAPLGAPPPQSVTSGSTLAVRVENRSSSPVYFALLNLSRSGRIKLMFPPAGAQDQLPIGGALERAIQLTTPVGRSEDMDIFKVIVATAAIDGTMFEQDAIKIIPQDVSGLDRFLRDRAAARPRLGDMITMSDWASAQAAVRVTSAALIVHEASYAAHFAQPADVETATKRLATHRAFCPSQDECAVNPFLSDPTVLEVRGAQGLKGVRHIGAAELPSVGQSFENAYALRDQLNADYVEPLLTLETPGSDPAEEYEIATRGGAAEPDPIAEADDLWSLKYAAVPEAWQRIRNTSARQAGREAEGVVIAHLDTGFTKHPENWGVVTPPPIAVERGRNYVEGGTDATDAMSTGLLKHPGHGTASGSVIVSPEGCQLGGARLCVTGIAPGARLVPARVHTSVVVFDAKRLAQAIDDAINGELGGPIDIISIAMGGPPSRTLKKVVDEAERRGVLVIAAAGNYVRLVVWPARFESVVAVSAVNSKCTPWAHASLGAAVDFSAPGQSVWRATFDASGAFIAGMGSGTTFATGTTSGIAALWLAHFRSDPKLQQLRAAGQLTQAFRDAVAHTSWRPEESGAKPPGVQCDSGVRWPKTGYGVGIIHADALLNRPLPDVAPHAVAPAQHSPLELWSSLYGDDADAALVERSYRSLFREQPIEASAMFETEVLFHYTTSDEVRRAIDRLVTEGTSAQAARDVRQALRSQDLSRRLRDALAPD